MPSFITTSHGTSGQVGPGRRGGTGSADSPRVRQLWRQRADHTLQSAALVNEAYLRLVHQQSPHWQNRPHFFGVAAQMMRHILVDYARSRLAAKRGAGARRSTLDTKMALPQSEKEQAVNLIVLDNALNKLAEVDPRQSRVIELRFFGGLSIEDTAVMLGISPATVKREWTMARVWLHREMNKEARK